MYVARQFVFFLRRRTLKSIKCWLHGARAPVLDTRLDLSAASNCGDEISATHKYVLSRNSAFEINCGHPFDYIYIYL